MCCARIKVLNSTPVVCYSSLPCIPYELNILNIEYIECSVYSATVYCECIEYTNVGNFKRYYYYLNILNGLVVLCTMKYLQSVCYLRLQRREGRFIDTLK